MRLFALRLALDHTRANVVLGADAGDGLDVLALLCGMWSAVVPWRKDLGSLGPILAA